MKNIVYLPPLLMAACLLMVSPCKSQSKGHIYNIQAEERLDGSDIVDVYYDLDGYAQSYVIQANLYHVNTLIAAIPQEYCTGDYGQGVIPGSNKHFEYYIGGHKPNVEWESMKIEIRAYFPMGNSCPNLPSVEYYGKVYETIQIGGQCWLKQNLDVGTQIPYENLPWNDENIEKYCYDNNPANCETYGALYHWWEAMFYGEAIPGKQGICPPGFHIPTYLEFEVLIDLFGGKSFAGGHLKSLSFWNTPNTGASNTSFFSAFGSGAGYNTPGIGGGDLCYDLQKTSYLFHSNLPENQNKPALKLRYDNAAAELLTLPAEPYPFGSVRCMKNCDNSPTSSNAGPDQQISNSNYAILAANSPENGIGKWKIVSQHATGKGGVIENEYQPNSGFYGYPGQTYTVTWVISNECTASNDECNISFSAFTCGQDFTDHRNGKVYPTVQVGDYCWMAKNMDIGEQITLNVNVYNDAIIQKYCYNDDPANCEEYGGLYGYSEAVQYQYTADKKQGICPLGWFVPKDADWCNLTHTIDATVNCSALGWTGTDVGGKMKVTGYDFWNEPNTGATNSSGFSALGAGYATIDIPEDGYAGLKESTRFWTPTAGPSQTFYVWSLGNTEARIYRTYLYYYYNAMSVRCVYYPNY